jgi:hypothetical protein
MEIAAGFHLAATSTINLAPSSALLGEFRKLIIDENSGAEIISTFGVWHASCRS